MMNEFEMTYEEVVKDLEEHPAKQIWWRDGWLSDWTYISRNPVAYPTSSFVCDDGRYEMRVMANWKEALKEKYYWARKIVIEKNTDDEIHIHAVVTADDLL